MRSLIEKLETMREKVDNLVKWERQGSMTMVNRDAHYQALAVVKDHVLKWVTSVVSDMKNEDIKHVPVGGGELTVRKIMADMYSGTVRRGTENIHQFDRITLPQLAGQLQSLLELYDPDKVEEKADPTRLIIDKLKPIAEQAQNGLVSQLISMLDKKPVIPKTPEVDAQREVEEIIAEANFITEEAKRRMQVVDPKAEVMDLKERVEAMLARVESIVSANAPTTQSNDLLHDTLHQMQVKHDQLTDRAQQELRILDDKIKLLEERLAGRNSEKTITITVK